MIAKIHITFKNGVLDPQGKAVHHALESLGYKEVQNIRIGKQIILDIDTNNKEEAIQKAKEMADKLLANVVIENYEVEVKE